MAEIPVQKHVKIRPINYFTYVLTTQYQCFSLLKSNFIKLEFYFFITVVENVRLCIVIMCVLFWEISRKLSKSSVVSLLPALKMTTGKDWKLLWTCLWYHRPLQHYANFKSSWLNRSWAKKFLGIAKKTIKIWSIVIIFWIILYSSRMS